MMNNRIPSSRRGAACLLFSALLISSTNIRPKLVNAELQSPNSRQDRLEQQHNRGRNLFDLDIIPFEDDPGQGIQEEESPTETPEPQTSVPQTPAPTSPPTQRPTRAPQTTVPQPPDPQTSVPQTPAPSRPPTQRPTRAPHRPEFLFTRSPTAPPRPDDFANFNEIFKNAVIQFPDLDIQEDIVYQPLAISLTNFACSKISFEDIKVDSELNVPSDPDSNQTIHIDFEVVNLAINCEFDFRWSYIFLSGNGHALVTTGENGVMAGIDVFSEDFSQRPPDSAEVTTCQTDINIVGLDFSGNIASEVFNLFEELIIDVVGDLINEKICVELNGIGAEMLADLFDSGIELVDPYLQPVADWRLNASHPEFNLMEVGPNTSLVSWNDEEGFGVFLSAGLDEVEKTLSVIAEDPTAPDKKIIVGPNGTEYPEGYDLGINTLLREYLLEEDRAFVLNLTSLGINGTFVNSHDSFTETKLTLQQVQVYGLDTFTRLKPFTRIGNFTLLNDISWDYLQIEVVMRMEIKASSLEDSIIRDAERIEPYVEDFKINVGVENIDIVAAVLFALEPDQMRALKVGPLLDLSSMIPCVIGSLYEFGLTRFNVTVGDIQLPYIEGLVSPGVDRLLSDAVEAGFLMYKDTLLKALPALFETTIRDLLTETIESLACPVYDTPEEDSYVDLRDLLLDPEESELIGGTGESQYGDIASAIYGIIRELWLEFEEDGTLGLNNLLIGPLTELFSGSSGLLSFPGELFNFTTSDQTEYDLRTLVNKFEFGIYDLKVQNLDTVVHPMTVIEPINHPYITQSSLNMGPISNRPLNASITVLMALDIEDSPLAMNNIINFGVSVASVELFVEALTMLSANNMLNFRLGDGLVVSCWFAMLPPPQLNYKGFRVDGAVDRGIELRRLFAKLSDLELDIECVQCSAGFASIPDLVDLFDRTQITDILSVRLPLFLEEVAISDRFQVAFDRWLTDAPYSCPHRIEYDKSYSRPSHWEMPEFKSLSLEASDTIFFTTLVVAQLAFVLLVETHYPWNLQTLAPLSGQQSFVPPEDSNMVDWMDLDGQTGEGFDAVAEDFRKYLREEQDEVGTNERDLGINVLLRDLVLDKDGSIDLVSMLGSQLFEFSIQGLVFQFHSVKIRGLDSFTNFEVLQPIAPQTILNSISMRYLEVELVVSTGSRVDPPQIVSTKLGFEDINASVPIFAAFDLNIFHAIEIGHLLTLGQIFPCLMSASYGVHFPQVLVTIGNFSVPIVEGFLPDSEEALRQSIAENYDLYANKTLKALPVMLDTSIRAFVNTFIAEYIDTEAKCTHLEDKLLYNRTSAARNVTDDDDDEPEGYLHPYDGYVDFRELLAMPDESAALGGRGFTTYGTLIRSLVRPIQKELLALNPKTKLSGINALIAPITDFISGEEGTVFVEGDLVEPIDFQFNFGGLQAVASFGFADFRLENLDTVGDPLSLGAPVLNRPQLLNHSAGIGIGKATRASIRFSVGVQLDEASEKIENEVSISLNLKDGQALFKTLISISESGLIHFPLESIANPWCWLSLIPAPELDERGIRPEGVEPTVAFSDLVVKVAELSLNVSCIDCATPGIQRLSDTLAKPESLQALTDIANKALRLGSEIVMGNLVQDPLDRFLQEGPRRCPHHPDYVPGAKPLKFDPLNFDRSVGVSPLFIKLVFIGLGFFVAVIAVIVLVKWIVWRRNKRWLLTLPTRKLHILELQQEAALQMEQELNASTSAMLTAKEIPLFVRYLMPLTIFGNIAFFLTGHLDIAAETRLEAQIVGQPVTLDNVFEFSVLRSMEDMFDAGAIEMAVFLMIFALIWPYVKQFTTLFCWLTPPSKLSISKRGSIYLWLDTLAKWSMVDIFVLLISMVAFRVEAVTPDVAFLPSDFFLLRVYIIPRWGLYANLIAQMISQVSSHYIIYYHRLIVKEATKKYEEHHHLKHHTPHAQQASTMKSDTIKTDSDSDERSEEEGDAMKRKRLCDNAFTRPHKGHISKLVVRKGASYAVGAGACLIVLFLVLGCAFDSVGVEVQGLVSFVSGGVGGNVVYKDFSAFSIAKLLMDDARQLGENKSIVGYGFLSFVVLSSVFFVPFFQTLALLYHWYKPMNDMQKRKFSGVIEILAAWQYAEVFILALFISSWQLPPTSETLMVDQCADFEPVFEMLTYYGVLEKEHGNCFRVEPEILVGGYLMALAAVLLALMNSFVMKASSQYFWDKETAQKALALEKEAIDAEVGAKAFKKLRPPPVLFTDTFRWVLRRQNLGDTSGRRPLRTSIVMLSPPPPRPDEERTPSGSHSNASSKA